MSSVMAKMNKLLFQIEHVFNNQEDERAIAAQYFEVFSSLSDFKNERIFGETKYKVCRGSCDFAKIVKEAGGPSNYPFDFANCLNFMPHFREHLINPDIIFSDLRHFENFAFPAFIRPASPLKQFAGQVFPSLSKYKEEIASIKPLMLKR